MVHEQRAVRDFHEAFDILINELPTVVDEQTAELRLRLIREETKELETAFAAKDIVLVADALADLLYVVYGAAVSSGIDMQSVFDEVHASNLSKIGGHKDEGGKWIKPVSYTPADLKPIIDEQINGKLVRKFYIPHI